MAGHTTEEAIKAVARALHLGVHEVACKFDLVQDGFPPTKAAVIVRWAQRMNQCQQRVNPFRKRLEHLKKKEIP
jgi:hypothetical protein